MRHKARKRIQHLLDEFRFGDRTFHETEEALLDLIDDTREEARKAALQLVICMLEEDLIEKEKNNS